MDRAPDEGGGEAHPLADHKDFAMNLKSLLIAASLGLVTTVSVPAPAVAADAPVHTGTFNKLAVSGYDTVAYFSQKKPTKGSAPFTTSYKGAPWCFANAANLAAFRANPARVAPIWRPLRLGGKPRLHRIKRSDRLEGL